MQNDEKKNFIYTARVIFQLIELIEGITVITQEKLHNT